MKRRRSWILMGLAVALTTTLRGPMTQAATDDWQVPPPTGAQVVAAIKHGADFLQQQQKPEICWEPGRHSITASGYQERGGESALVLEALLYAGQSLHLPELNIFSPQMQAAIKYVASIKTHDTYVASFQANAMALLPPKREYMKVLQRDRKFLAASISRGGGYSYRWPGADGQTVRQRGDWDNSNTQYGVLGMWACGYAGLHIPLSYWQRVGEHWRRYQYPDGTWGYNGHLHRPAAGSESSRPDSMTPAGLASLFIADEFTHTAAPIEPVPDQNIRRGLNWLMKNFHPDNTDIYVLYGYARVGLACGLQNFGDRNWYNVLASELLTLQGHRGDWHAGIVGPPQVDSDIIGTAYAMLVLDRGLNPIVFNKLQYGTHYYGQWNARPRDDANLTSWMSRTFETPLNWQVVNMASPVSDWLDSPILYIAGHQDPHFSSSQLAKLKAYVGAGGIIFSNSDGGSKVFTKAMAGYAQAVAGPQYRVVKLPPTSPLYTLQPWFHSQRPPWLLAVSNGARYLWIISPRDMAATWQRRLFGIKEDWEIAANLYFYATGKAPLANRLQSLVVAPPAAQPKLAIHVAHLKFKGNWNPEPGAWPRMAQLAAADFGTAMTVRNQSILTLNAHTTPLAVLGGVGTFRLTPEQIAHLRAYLNKGGTLLVDSIGGGSAFTAAFQAVQTELYPGTLMRQLPDHSRIYTGRVPNGVDASVVHYRKYYVEKNGVKSDPDLMGIKRHGRWVLLFSSEDITSGLLGTNTWGIAGYVPTSAQKLVRNMLGYVMAEHAPARQVKGKAAK